MLYIFTPSNIGNTSC